MNLHKKILIADDEKNITDIVAFNLKNKNFDVVCVHDGHEALKAFPVEKPDLLLLDVMMPTMDGFEVCKRIREISQVPIIMLTAKADENDKVLGLEIGADDYVLKPFSMSELIARINANLRRFYEPKPKKMVNYGNFKIDFNRNEVVFNKKTIALTPKEFDLLRFLVSQPNIVFSRDELLHQVWRYDYYGDARTVDVTIRRLRTKIEKIPDKPEFILTRRGKGYYFCPEQYENNN